MLPTPHDVDFFVMPSLPTYAHALTHNGFGVILIVSLAHPEGRTRSDSGLLKQYLAIWFTCSPVNQ